MERDTAVELVSNFELPTLQPRRDAGRAVRMCTDNAQVGSPLMKRTRVRRNLRSGQVVNFIPLHHNFLDSQV